MFFLMLFADDMVILDKSPADLQHDLILDLDWLSECCSKWGFKLILLRVKF